MSDLASINFETLTPAEFEAVLPDLFASGGGKVSEDPRLKTFLDANPDCAELVRDLEIIAQHAKSLFEPVHEPSPDVWSNIASKLSAEPRPEPRPDLRTEPRGEAAVDFETAVDLSE